MSTHIYQGAWVNWSHGAIRGATITLDDRSGGLLTSFIATFITLVSTQLWRIICFAAHQIRSSDHPRDGLHHQQQVILRNIETPGSAAWTFALQLWYWRHTIPRSFRRTLPWVTFATVYLLLFALAAIFSADISRAPSSPRLIIGNVCGYWGINVTGQAADPVWAAKTKNETLLAATYARACYGGSSDPLQCGRLPVSEIKWDGRSNASCPFAAGTCALGDTAAYNMTTIFIDSHRELGINAPEHDRVQIQLSTVCAPLNLSSYVTTTQGTNAVVNDTFYQYWLGPISNITSGQAVLNYTHAYNTHLVYSNFGYTIDSSSSKAGSFDVWEPIAALNLTDADISLILISANSMNFEAPSNDPVFKSGSYKLNATDLDGNTFYWYDADYYVGGIACSEQSRVCNPVNGICSPYLGAWQVRAWTRQNAVTNMQLNKVQQSTVLRLFDAMEESTMHDQLSPRQGDALRALETANGLDQAPLPDNQWMLEVSGWFDTSLARGQQRALQFATGPPQNLSGAFSYVATDVDPNIDRRMCGQQLVNDAQNTTSFSVLGLSIVLILGFIIVLTNQTIEQIVGWFQARFHWNQSKGKSWNMDHQLQLQRHLHEAWDRSRWIDGPVPVTVDAGKFVGLASTSQVEGRGYAVVDHDRRSGFASESSSQEPEYKPYSG